MQKRWEDNGEIQQALKARKASCNIIGSFDFLDAERQARAKINIVEIDYCGQRENVNDYRRVAVDPFELFCEEFLGIKNVISGVQNILMLNE